MTHARILKQGNHTITQYLKRIQKQNFHQDITSLNRTKYHEIGSNNREKKLCLYKGKILTPSLMTWLIPGPNKREAVFVTLRWSHSQRTKSPEWSTFHKSHHQLLAFGQPVTGLMSNSHRANKHLCCSWIRKQNHKKARILSCT